MNPLKHPISKAIWEMKYRFTAPNGKMEKSVEDTWRRVAKAIAGAEKSSEQSYWQQKFYAALEDFQFLPGGRILAGAGTEHHVTLFNCFVMDIAEDSLTGIFNAIKEGALTLQQGGGVGYDFSILRPRGSRVVSADTIASGPVSFMRVWDAMSSVLLSTGARRGAMMGVLRCDHPDIEEFILAKANAQALRHFNLSVMVSDEFMQAVKKNEEWALVFPAEDEINDEIVYRQWGHSVGEVRCRVYRRIKARKLWEQIIRSAYEYAEPGVLFGDVINRFNNLWYCEQINAVNPCGEIPLPAYGACDLGSLNLTQFVNHAFKPQAAINWFKLEEVAAIATRFLDNVIDVSQYPLEAQRKQAHGTRRIGLGVTGLADMFVMLGIRYGSSESIALAGEIMQRIANVTWHTSIELASEKGVFPFYHQDYLCGEFVKTLDESILRKLAATGVRNSHHNSIAPTGTISLLANNVSNGIEPIFKSSYDRHVRTIDNVCITYHIEDYAWRLWHEQHATAETPPAWIDVTTLTPGDHLQIQAAMQQHIDNAISKTINIPHDYPFSELSQVYTQAYDLGLKGCTIFRPNPVTGSVLEAPAEPGHLPDLDRCCQE